MNFHAVSGTMRDSDLFGKPLCPHFTDHDGSDVPAQPWHGVGLTGPSGERALSAADRHPGPNSHALCLYDTPFSEQRLDFHSQNPRARGAHAALYLAPDMYSGPPTCPHRMGHYVGAVVPFFNGRNIYERANNCFRASNIPQQDYLIEFVSPAPQRVWWCSRTRYRRYITIAASIFFSRLEALTEAAWGPGSARAWGPQLDFGWRRDILHQYHGSYVMVRDTASAIKLSPTQASTLFENAFLRVRRQVIVQSAVMAAEASLLNSKRRLSSVAYHTELRELVAQCQTEPQVAVLERYLNTSMAAEEDYQQNVRADPLLNTNA